MNGDIVGTLHDKVIRVSDMGTESLPSAVESLLLQELGGMALQEKLRTLEQLADRLSGGCEVKKTEVAVDPKQASRLFSMLLGKELSAGGLSSEEMADKFVEAMNTIFDTLNRIIRVMQTTLTGENEELETIRQVIGSQMERYEGTTSVKEYLDQIQQAFLVSHDSFQKAARNLATEILDELDPEKISSSTGTGLRFGPLRKAELFDICQERHQVMKEWLQSPKFTERLLREFEGICRKSHGGK